jgi:hypothetical protein
MQTFHSVTHRLIQPPDHRLEPNNRDLRMHLSKLFLRLSFVKLNFKVRYVFLTWSIAEWYILSDFFHARYSLEKRYETLCTQHSALIDRIIGDSLS